MKVTTFWSLLKDNKITIPIVQRDYAQGREDQVKVRKRFLKSLTRALKGEKNVLLDYVHLIFANHYATSLYLVLMI